MDAELVNFAWPVFIRRDEFLDYIAQTYTAEIDAATVDVQEYLMDKRVKDKWPFVSVNTLYLHSMPRTRRIAVWIVATVKAREIESLAGFIRLHGL